MSWLETMSQDTHKLAMEGQQNSVIWGMVTYVPIALLMYIIRYNYCYISDTSNT